MPENHEDWYAAVDREVVKGKPESKRKFLEITHEPEIIADSQGRPMANEDGTPLKMGPQRVNNFQNAKMHIHSIAEFFRAMGCRYTNLIQNGTVSEEVDGMLRQLDGQGTYQAEIIWRAYFKSTDTTVSTHPRGKKSGELLWPRDAQGNYELLAKNPSTGESAYGYAEIRVYKIPQAASQETMASAAS